MLFHKEINNTAVKALLTKYDAFANSTLCKPAISFSWEEGTTTKAVFDEAVNIMKNTEILVVIGYSFPYFNREVDRILLNEKNAPKLRKVYVQDIEPDNIIETIKGFRENGWSKYAKQFNDNLSISWDERKFPFIAIKNLDQFHMPHEL